ncbi:hypothetical protein HRM2_05620 [Desulforapulum autotrophicum HRM2]|uniref:Uncharacterized protein n=1 Tax=Desulforapulum autotrophicum (strain ATCC 43914 / DSM 3382 / VKM B-1955 / HRM2) TaxID=177437 RepID=C0QHW8_DESAH|nr:hypothetical protein HRM2_05620 [Desulforapulum autotrophicum HRM2]
MHSFNPCCRGSGIPGAETVCSNPVSFLSFNPCCRGSGIPGGVENYEPGTYTLVSILVVVDQAFQDLDGCV